MEKLNMPETLVGERAIAVRRTHEHDQELFEMADKFRGHFGQHLHWVNKIQSIEDVVNFSEESIKLWDEGKAYRYTITTPNTKRPVGSIEIHTIDYKSFSAEFSYWLNPGDTGKGYVGDTLSRLEKILFDENEIIRIVIRSNTGNIPSNNVAIRNNYVLEGTLHKCRYRNGKFLDYNLYAKINPKLSDTL